MSNGATLLVFSVKKKKPPLHRIARFSASFNILTGEIKDDVAAHYFACFQVPLVLAFTISACRSEDPMRFDAIL